MQKRTIAAFMHREIRHVAVTWEHPRDENGEWIPLSDRRFLTGELVAEHIADGSATSRE
jgi:hypothetical protein